MGCRIGNRTWDERDGNRTGWNWMGKNGTTLLTRHLGGYLNWLFGRRVFCTYCFSRPCIMTTIRFKGAASQEEDRMAMCLSRTLRERWIVDGCVYGWMACSLSDRVFIDFMFAFASERCILIHSAVLAQLRKQPDN